MSDDEFAAALAALAVEAVADGVAEDDVAALLLAIAAGLHAEQPSEPAAGKARSH